SSQYWDAFDASSIVPTTVPEGSTLNVEYNTDGTTWLPLTTVDTTASSQTLSGPLSTWLGGTPATSVRGLRFTFADASGFGQSTNVKVGLQFVARSTLRVEGTSTAPAAY